MAKIGDSDIRGVSQELVDTLDDIKIIMNFGKYQKTTTTAVPTWTARLGEEVYVYAGGGSGALYTVTTDNTSNWRSVTTFTL